LRVLGIVCDTHDSGIALLEDGVPAFVLEEERFNRQKHTLKFPFLSLAAAMEERNLRIGDIDVITTPWDTPQLRRTFATSILARLPASLNLLRPGANAVQNGGVIFLTTWLKYELRRTYGFAHLPQIVQVGHHDAHAAIFFASPFEEAAVLVMDGYGDASATSTYIGSGNHLDRRWRGEFFDSLGMLYTFVTYHLGFAPFEEGTVMALAAGGGDTYRAKFSEVVHLGEVGSSRSIGSICATTAGRSTPSPKTTDVRSAAAARRAHHRPPPRSGVASATTEDVVLHRAPLAGSVAQLVPHWRRCPQLRGQRPHPARHRLPKRLGAALRLRHRRAARQRHVALPSDPRSPPRLRDDAPLLRHRL
jgi:predicted NodU family carbamoyl transferase